MKTLLLLTLLLLAGCSDDDIAQPEPQSANAFFEIIQGNTSIFAAYVNDTQYFYFTTDTVGIDFYLTGYTERTLHFNIMETDWHLLYEWT